MQFYANSLRDALRKANNRRKEVLAELTTDDWRRLVYRELQADRWYLEPQQSDVLEVIPSNNVPLVQIEHNGQNGQHSNGMVANV